jgi:hypothetical protein
MVRSPIGAGILADGTAVSAEILAERLGYLAQMVKRQARSRIFEVWAAGGVSAISDSAKSHAYVAMEEIYGSILWPPSDLHASDRVRRMAEELAGRTLRSAARQIGLLEAVLPVVLPSATWQALTDAQRSSLPSLPWPAGTAPTEKRDMLWAIRRTEEELGRIPSDPYEVINCPDFAEGFFLCPLDAADGQQVKLAGVELALLLPVCAYPGKSDWSWHTLTLKVPDFAQQRYAKGVICRPSLRVTPDKSYFLTPLDIPVPALSSSLKVFSLDWGARRLLTGVVVSIDPSDPYRHALTTGRPYFCNSRQWRAKLARLKDDAHILDTKIKQQGKLLAGLRKHHRTDPSLLARKELLEHQRSSLWRRIGEAQEQLAYAAAKWVIEQSLAEGCGVIGLEDLRTLQSRERGVFQNERTNSTVRGILVQKIIDLAQLAGLRVIFVNPRGTSSLCSRCGRPSVFWHAPDHQGGDPNWLVCACVRSSDRDQAGAESVGALALEVLFPTPSSPVSSSTPAPPTTSPAGRRTKPVAGLASRRRVRARRDKHRAAQETPYTYQSHMFDANADNQPPKPQRRPSKPKISGAKWTATGNYGHLPLRSGACRQTTPRRVSRGSVVAQSLGQAERSSLDGNLHRESRAANPALVLDGVSRGYWHAVKFSRPRVLARPA